MCIDEFLHDGQSKDCNDRVDRIYDTGSESCNEAYLMSAAQRLLNHKNGNRSDRGRRTDSYYERLQYIEKHIYQISK